MPCKLTETTELTNRELLLLICMCVSYKFQFKILKSTLLCKLHIFSILKNQTRFQSVTGLAWCRHTHSSQALNQIHLPRGALRLQFHLPCSHPQIISTGSVNGPTKAYCLSLASDVSIRALKSFATTGTPMSDHNTPMVTLTF